MRHVTGQAGSDVRTWHPTDPAHSVLHTRERVAVIKGEGYGEIAHTYLRVHHHHLHAGLEGREEGTGGEERGGVMEGRVGRGGAEREGGRKEGEILQLLNINCLLA